MNLKGTHFIWFIFIFFMTSPHGLMGQTGKYTVSSMGDSINSPYDEQAPVLSEDGKTLYFTRGKHPDNTAGKKDPGDIWISRKDSDGQWGIPVNAGQPLNNREYNAVIGIDGNAVYLIGHYLPDNKRPRSQGISVSHFNNGKWSFPKPVDIPYFSNISDHQSACLSYDGHIMVHAIQSYNTRGAEDLYVSFRKTDGSWTDVKNLGPAVNTAYQEKTPYLAADNRTLIFSSNGFGGEGSMDLFMTKRMDDSWKNWSKPVNIGNVINTPGRELYYYVIPGANEAIFCSTQNSDGYGDIKYYRLLPEDVIEPVEETILSKDTAIQEAVSNQNKFVMRGKVFNAQNNEPVNASISVFKNAGNPLATYDSKTETGVYQFEVSSGGEYLIRVGARGFMNVEQKISLNDSSGQLVLKNYYLEPLEVGKVFKLNNVLFHRATATLIDSSYTELDNVYRMMVDNPGISIELSGHTDNQGSARKNLELSQARVDTVKKYLVEKGIAPDRITGKGYGGTKPVASNRTEETRRLNRRVEFKVIRNRSIINEEE